MAANEYVNMHEHANDDLYLNLSKQNVSDETEL